MKVLDLCSGLEGWGAAFRERDHAVVSVDIDAAFGADLTMDVNDIVLLGKNWDVILASPPCETFSVASIGTHWTGGRRAYEPKTEKAKQMVALVAHIFVLVALARPKVYVVENPRGVLRKLFPNGALGEPVTTWYCQWGDTRGKPTDLWTNIRGEWPTCRNGNTDHESAPRGAKTGTQGIKGSALRAKIPYQLSLAVCLAAENGGRLV